MGFIFTIEKKGINLFFHKIFNCPSFWKSVFNTLLKSKPFYRCSKCKKAMHCYWDGNDTNQGTDVCNSCCEKLNLN